MLPEKCDSLQACDDKLTGRRLRIPHVYTMAYSNRSFEALTYNATTRRFWTTTENTLKCDGYKPTITNKEGNVVRLQSFGDDLEPLEQYWYMSDSTSTQDYYRRTRPFAYFNEPSLVSAIDSVKRNTYSYPSGHAVRGWMYALTLALVVPDATEELMKRAEEYAMSRIICGRHYKSDIEASLVEATAIMSRLLSNEAFTKQLSKAREEYQSKFCRPESSK